MNIKDVIRIEIDKQGGIQAVAKRIGIHQSSLSRTLNKKTNPKRITLLKICNELKIDLDAINGPLLDEVNRPNKELLECMEKIVIEYLKNLEMRLLIKGR